ncbi:MAG: hypothetical protein ACFFF4_17795, partial [Candidatus Thorarchaeota archaeon]
MASSNGSNTISISLERIFQTRRNLRRRINANKRIDKILHYYAALIFTLNIILIIYTLISLTARMLLLGVPLIDSVPLTFYILPLLVFLPKLLYDYVRTRTALLVLIILFIVSIIFGMIVPLVRGFNILIILNFLSIVIVIILGRFRPTAPFRSIGRKGIAWIIILNSLGLMLPVSIYAMGEFPIASTSYSESTDIYLEMPLSSFEYEFMNISPNSDIIGELMDAGFGVDLRVDAFHNNSIELLSEWLPALAAANIPIRLTSSAIKDEFLNRDPTLLGSTERLLFLYGHHWSMIQEAISMFEFLSLSMENLSISLDVTLSLS